MSILQRLRPTGKWGRIVEEEQHGAARAEYGSRLIAKLAEELSKEFAKGFPARDLRNYRQLYLCFKDLDIWYTRVPNLNWSHLKDLQKRYGKDSGYSPRNLGYMKSFASEYPCFTFLQVPLAKLRKMPILQVSLAVLAESGHQQLDFYYAVQKVIQKPVSPYAELRNMKQKNFLQTWHLRFHK